MTVVAWDGKTLACDKQSTRGEKIGTRTKMSSMDNGDVVVSVGSIDRSLSMVLWYSSGAKRTDFPVFQGTDDWVNLIVLSGGKVFEYQQEPVGIPCEDPYMAWGSGADFALGAMAVGATAVEAVLAASKHSTTCGMGVDSFTVDEAG